MVGDRLSATSDLLGKSFLNRQMTPGETLAADKGWLRLLCPKGAGEVS
jgi:hypothetical protein